MDEVLYMAAFFVMQEGGGIGDIYFAEEKSGYPIPVCIAETGTRQIRETTEADLFLPFNQRFSTEQAKVREEKREKVMPDHRRRTCYCPTTVSGNGWPPVAGIHGRRQNGGVCNRYPGHLSLLPISSCFSVTR